MHGPPVFAETGFGGGNEHIERGIGGVARDRHRQYRRRPHQAITVRTRELGTDIADVVTAIAIAWKRDRLAMRLKVSQPGRQREDVHLAAGVVDVELARDLETGGGEQVGQCRSVGRPATMPDMQGPGGVGRHELDLYATILPERGMTVAVTGGEDAADDVALGGRLQEQVDEARTRDLGASDMRGWRQVIDDCRRDLARVAAQLPRQLQGEVAGVVTMACLLRAVENHRSAACLRRDGFEGGFEQRREVGLEVGDGCCGHRGQRRKRPRL